MKRLSSSRPQLVRSCLLRSENNAIIGYIDEGLSGDTLFGGPEDDSTLF